MPTPHLRHEGSGATYELGPDVTTVGRGRGVDIALDDPGVSRLHAELVRRGEHVYVSDLGLSTNGTRVNGRPVGRHLLVDGDVLSFGNCRTRIGGLPHDLADDTVELRRMSAPDLTRRECEVLTSLCRPALQQEAKFKIPEGVNRRARLANEVIGSGVVRPLPTDAEAAIRRAG